MTDQQARQAEVAARTRKTVLKLGAGILGMFGFAYALVPLYDVLCEVTGLNGRTAGQYQYQEADLVADDSREVRVRFVTNVNAGMPWEFGIDRRGETVTPGGMHEAVFYAHNPTDRVMVAQTIPSVAPGRAATFFHKTECFCFDQQLLEPGETVEMPMRFIVDRDLPDSVSTISLSYTMFDITDQVADIEALRRAQSTDS